MGFPSFRLLRFEISGLLPGFLGGVWNACLRALVFKFLGFSGFRALRCGFLDFCVRLGFHFWVFRPGDRCGAQSNPVAFVLRAVCAARGKQAGRRNRDSGLGKGLIALSGVRRPGFWVLELLALGSFGLFRFCGLSWHFLAFFGVFSFSFLVFFLFFAPPGSRGEKILWAPGASRAAD